MDTEVIGISLITRTNEEVDQAAELLRAVGLTVEGEDGFVAVQGPALNLTIMRGAMIEVPPQGGVLLQLRVPDVDAASEAARRAGGEIALGPSRTEWGSYSAFIRSPIGFAVELQGADRL